MPTSVRKSIQIKVSLTPDLYERLKEVSEAVGQAPATAASMAIGLWVRQQEAAAGAAKVGAEAIAAHLGPEMAEQMRQLAFPKGSRK